jgi:hypothetical protein
VPGSALQPAEFLRLERSRITTALDLGWSLWALKPASTSTVIGPYSSAPSAPTGTSSSRQRISGSYRQLRPTTLLVWCMSSQASKHAQDEWIPIGRHFEGLS